MSTFWAGAGAALVGAVIGGIFTTLAARMQAASSLRTINYELQQSFTHERQQRKTEIIREGLTRLLNAGSGLIELLDQIFEDHQQCGGHCTRDTLPIDSLKSCLRQLDRLEALYGYGTLVPTLKCKPDGFWDFTSDIITTEAADQLHSLLVSAAREDPINRSEQDACNYRLVANRATFQFLDTMECLRRALRELT